MQIDFQMRTEDYSAFSEHLLQTSDVLRAQRARQRIVLTGLVFAAVVVVIGGAAHDWTGGLVTAVVVAVGMWLALPRINRWAAGRRVRELAAGEGLGLDGAASLRADDVGLHETVAGVTTSVAWDRVARIDETDRHVFVFIGPTAALIVPKTVGDVSPMIAEIRSRTSTSN
ncbi:YcxB family protein [Luteimicrobium sp. DT211]|uniref:YcxB family protein n=1 Tax=Luteimicrobium sp. DT211 TaxID=3393412 RepID=UPI003CF45E86